MVNKISLITISIYIIKYIYPFDIVKTSLEYIKIYRISTHLTPPKLTFGPLPYRILSG